MKTITAKSLLKRNTKTKGVHIFKKLLDVINNTNGSK